MAKKLALGVVVLFLGFWLFTDPSGLATTAKGVGGAGWTGVSALFTHVISFVQDM